MSEIAEYMRQGGPCIELNERCKVMDAASGCACAKAAAEIERLRAALREIESNWEVPMEEKGWRALARFMWETARAALEDRT